MDWCKLPEGLLRTLVPQKETMRPFPCRYPTDSTVFAYVRRSLNVPR